MVLADEPPARATRGPRVVTAARRAKTRSRHEYSHRNSLSIDIRGPWTRQLTRSCTPVDRAAHDHGALAGCMQRAAEPTPQSTDARLRETADPQSPQLERTTAAWLASPRKAANAKLARPQPAAKESRPSRLLDGALLSGASSARALVRSGPMIVRDRDVRPASVSQKNAGVSRRRVSNSARVCTSAAESVRRVLLLISWR